VSGAGSTFILKAVSRLLMAGCLAYGAAAGARGSASAGEENPTVMIVVGAAGEEPYGEAFVQWADQWISAAKQAKARILEIGRNEPSEVEDREQLRMSLETEPRSGNNEFWLVLIGHGTFDGEVAKFNMRGPDVSAAELSEWLDPVQRPTAVVNVSSSSAPFLNRLSRDGRVIVTATRSGYEQNYARFGGFMAGAIASPEADLDKDGQTSLLEAFLIASRQVEDWYRSETRLATEHALIDDNGDGLGTPADWFRGVRPVKKAEEGGKVDGLRAHQWHLIRSEFESQLPAEIRARRDELEMRVFELRERKPSMEEEEYYRRLEELLLEMAEFYQQHTRNEP
jgi:hypothetical protein